MQKIVCAFLFLAATASALAQSNILTAQTGVPETGSSAPRFSGFGALTYNSNMYEQGAVESETSLSANLTLQYRVAGANLIRANVGGMRENTQGQEYKLNDGFVGWANNGLWHRGKVVTIGQQVRAFLPMSEESRKRDQKEVGVGVAPMFIFNLTPVGLTGLTLIYQPQATKNFHHYKQNRVYQNNVEYVISQSLRTTWSITDKFYVENMMAHSKSWDYGGNAQNDMYSFSFEAGYSLINEAILAVGMTNKNSITNLQNGTDHNFELYNKNTATIYSALYLIF